MAYCATAQYALNRIGLTASTPATVAFSFRKLTDSYTGPAINVRRDSDDAMQDIGFDVNGELDSTELNTFVGTANGFVHTWYDQSGNNTHLIQTLNSRQPRIVANGVIERENGKPFLRFFSFGEFNVLLLPAPITNNGMVMVINKFINPGDGFLLGHIDHYYWHSEPPSKLFAGYASASIANSKIWQNGIVKSFDDAVYNNELLVNTVEPQTANSGTDWDNIGQDRVYHQTSMGGGYAEVISFATPLSNNNRQLAETNTIQYYATASIDPVLNNYPVVVAYGLRKLKTSYNGPAIEIRRSNDNTTTQIGWDANGHLDTATLKTFGGIDDVYVSTWYDQSGNNRHLTQTNFAWQPIIMQSSSIIRRNGQPTIYHGTSYSGLSYAGPPYLIDGPYSVNLVAGSNSNSGSPRRAIQGSNNWLIGPYGNLHSWYAEGWNHNTTPVWSTTSNEIFTVVAPLCSNASSWRNGTTVSSGNNKTAPQKISTSAIGSYGEPLDGFISEIIVFNYELNSIQRQEIEINQATYNSLTYTTNNDPVTPIICTQPSSANQNICKDAVGDALTVVSNGVNYQWYSNTINSNVGGTPISGATSSTFNIPTNVGNTTNFYYVEITGSVGNTIISEVSGAIYIYPEIIGNINGVTTGYDSLTLTASGGVSYEWSGGNNMTSAINSINKSNFYSVKVFDADGCFSTVGTNVTILRLAMNRYGAIGTDSMQHVNQYGKIASSQKVDKFGTIKNAGLDDGRTASTAGSSAYQIKQQYPSSADGLYWIKNININGGIPFQIYADMTTDGGGWTLILCNKSPNPGWNNEEVLLKNENSPAINSTYSIVGWADFIKRSASGFQYMLEANSRGSYGGIWTANSSYSFVSTSNANTNITLDTKFGTWDYNDSGVEARMPWYAPGQQGLLTTSNDANGNWWGTLIASGGWNPAPWMGIGGMPHPDIIWYWVR